MGNNQSDQRAHYSNEAGSRSTPPAYFPPPSPVDITPPPPGQIIHPEPVLPPNPGDFGMDHTTGYAHDKNVPQYSDQVHDFTQYAHASPQHGRTARLERTE